MVPDNVWLKSLESALNTELLLAVTSVWKLNFILYRA